MTCSTNAVEASYAACRRVSRQSGSSFYTGFLLLSGAKRRAMDALYAFARLTDDIVDGSGPVEQRRRQLALWRQAVEEAWGRRLEPSGFCTAGQHATWNGANPLVLLLALVDTAERFAIPREYFDAMIDGAAMDLDRSRYETFEELQGYCRRVASAVGLACVRIWGFLGDDVFEPAEKCGIALQLTNILRDIKEDLARDRVYLPQNDLRQHQYTETDLRMAIADSRFEQLMAAQIERAEHYFREGRPVLLWLEPSGRRVCGVMIDRYRALLEAIARHPEAVLHRRIALGAPAKTRVVLRWLLGGCRRQDD